ncbi:MAG TPA: hypothetical protein VIK66_14840 [Gaiellaceae bacterium]
MTDSAFHQDRLLDQVLDAAARPHALDVRGTSGDHVLAHGVRGRRVRAEVRHGRADDAAPGGAYVCTFTLGSAHAQATLLSSGPTGDVVDIEICTIENAFKYGTFPVCKSDQTEAPISGGTSIVCDGVLPNATGTNVALRFTASDGTVVSQARTTAISQPMQQNYASVPTSALHAGTTYACQFTLNGAVVAEKQFSLAP